MRYCEICGYVMDEFNSDRNRQNCPICEGVWSEDEMTALKYSELSETEKDSYDERLLNLIKNSPVFDELVHYENCSTEKGSFWYGFRVEKMARIYPDFPQERLAEIYKERKSNEPFKPFPPIDTVKAREVADEAEIERKMIERGYYTRNTSRQDNVPKCPTCNSADISRISATAKVVNAAMFGIFGQKRKHQFKCNNCKYEW